MITRIEAYRYRCFEKLDLIFDRFQVFVGPNGAGKTTLLDIPIVLGEMLTARSIEVAFFESTPTHQRPRADAASELIFNHSGEFFVLAVEARLPDEIVADLLEKRVLRVPPTSVEKLRNSPQQWLNQIRYEIQFEIFNDALQIGQEHLLLLPASYERSARVIRGRQLRGLLGEWVKGRRSNIIPIIQRLLGGGVRFYPEAAVGGARNVYRFPPTEPAFANVFADRTRYPASLWFRDLLTKQTCSYQPSLTALRTAQPRPRKPEVSRDAASLPWLAYHLSPNFRGPNESKEQRAARLKRFQRWERTVRLALPNMESIEPVVREDDKHAYLRLHYRNGAVVSATALSDGTLYVLALTILGYAQEIPPIVGLEEPENGIYPKGVEIVMKSLQSIRTAQVLCSTHAPLVLSQCQPNQIVCMRLAMGGAATAVRGDEDEALQKWKGTMDLGTLLAAGILG